MVLPCLQVHQKFGKTYFLLQLAATIALKNSYFLGNPTNYSKVLYFSNETSEKEMSKRLNSLNIECNNLFMDFSRTLTLEDIQQKILEYKSNKMLIIIDTLQNIKYSIKYDNNSYQSIYDLINKYMNIAQLYNVSFILVHHLNKNANSNDFNNINGSVAFLGACENLMILSKDGENEYQLICKGRNSPDYQLNLMKNEKGFFQLSESEKLIACNDMDIIHLMNCLAKEKIIEDTANNICSNFNLKCTSPNVLFKKLEKYKDVLTQSDIVFSKKKSNGTRSIKLELIENVNSEE